MCKRCSNTAPLDTLAQLGTTQLNSTDNQEFGKLEKATNKEDKRVFQNRAKRKYLSQSLSLGLVKATEIKHEKIPFVREIVEDSFLCYEEQQHFQTLSTSVSIIP